MITLELPTMKNESINSGIKITAVVPPILGTNKNCGNIFNAPESNIVKK